MEDARRHERGDDEVIRDVLNGDVDAFELLMDRYQDYVCRIVTRKVPGDQVEEVAHEAFVRAYRSLKTFRAKTPFRHWLASIAVRSCYDFWRDRYRNRETPMSSISEDDRDWLNGLPVNGSVGDHARSRQALRVLRWAMERLSAEDRIVLALIYLEGHTAAQTAELLRWSVPKVKIHAYRARKKLRRTLSSALRGG